MSHNNMQVPAQSLSRWPVLIVVALLLVFGGAFVIEFAVLTDTAAAIPEDQLTEISYMERVEGLLAEADPSRAVGMIYGEGINCAGCHLSPGGLAPSFDHLPNVAAERRPPLQPAAYIYESIIFPETYIVKGAAWRAVMPVNFADTLSDQQLGDVIAWLLLPPDERPMPEDES